MAYDQIDDGEMTELTPDHPLEFACCDCGLIHVIEVSSSTTLRWSLKPKATRRYRKRHKLPCVVKGK